MVVTGGMHNHSVCIYTPILFSAGLLLLFVTLYISLITMRLANFRAFGQLLGVFLEKINSRSSRG